MLLITSVLSGCAHVSLSTATIYGVLGVGSDSSDVKGSQGPILSVVFTESQGLCCQGHSSILLVLGGGVGKKEQGTSWKKMGWGVKASYIATRNETFCGLTYSKFKGYVRGKCRCWF